MEGTGLIIGIEYNKVVEQACVYDMKSHAPVAYDGVKGLDIDTALVRICEKYDIYDIACLCITTTEEQPQNIESIGSNICGRKLNIDNCMIIGHVQAFAYYAYSQRKELYQAGVVLMDYDGVTLGTSRLSYETDNGIQYISEQYEKYEVNPGNKEEDFNKDSAKHNIIMAAHKLSEYVAGYFNEHKASSVYLTGKGYDVDRLPDELAKALISGRKAYMGQNLYVRGACYAAYEAVYKDVFDNVVLLVKDCIRVNIEVDISEHGHPMRFRMLKQGTDWHMAERSADFIIEDITALSLKLIGPDGTCMDRTIDISSIPYREGKTTRIRMDVKAVSQDRFIVTIQDLGFGEFFKSSGRVITEQIDISEDSV